MTAPVPPDAVPIYIRIGTGEEHPIGWLRQPANVAEAAPHLLAALLRDAATVVEVTPLEQLRAALHDEPFTVADALAAEEHAEGNRIDDGRGGWHDLPEDVEEP